MVLYSGLWNLKNEVLILDLKQKNKNKKAECTVQNIGICRMGQEYIDTARSTNYSKARKRHGRCRVQEL